MSPRPRAGPCWNLYCSHWQRAYVLQEAQPEAPRHSARQLERHWQSGLRRRLDSDSEPSTPASELMKRSSSVTSPPCPRGDGWR